MKRRYFIFDPEKCIGCFNCLHACKDEHVGNDFSPVALPQKLHQQYWLTTTEHIRGQHPMVDVAYLTEPCGHCENAPCVAEGGGAVIRRPDGVVLIDPERAKGKGDLSRLCPFGKISYNEEQGVSQKCTFCAHLLDEGWKQPRCAQACPLEALRMEYAEPEEMARRAASGELAPLDAAHAACGSALYLKNAARLNTLFLGGSVATGEGPEEVCAENCPVALLRDGAEVQRQRTNAFGEFKFDGLKPGIYQVVISPGEMDRQTDPIELTESRSIGVCRI